MATPESQHLSYEHARAGRRSVGNIRRQCRACQRPGRLLAGLPGWLSLAGVVLRCRALLYGQSQATTLQARRPVRHGKGMVIVQVAGRPHPCGLVPQVRLIDRGGRVLH